MKKWIGIVFCLLLGYNAGAQRYCATAPARIITDADSPLLTARDTVPNEVIIIPVVVHVLFNNAEQNIPDAQVKSQIESLNRDFRRMNTDTAQTPAAFAGMAADARIMFCLAQVSPDGRPTNGIIHRYTNKEFFLGDDAMKFTAAGGDNAWDTRRYLNIWVCNLFGRSLGYATYPGGPAELDGVVIKYDVFGTIGNLREPFHKGRTATHELGHWLGLEHIWGDERCGDDEVADTPPQQDYHYHCPSFPQISSCSVQASGDMFMNYMDFTDDACMNLFTQGQKSKMRSQFARTGKRNALLSAYVCDSSLASGAPIPNDTLAKPAPIGYIRAYPVPTQEYCIIQGMEGFDLSGCQIHIVNMQGQILQREQALQNTHQLNLGALAPGIYLVQANNGKTKKLVKIVRLP